MSRELSTYELALIDKSILGKLEGHELREFEDKLNDADFKTEYELQKDFALALEAKEDQRKKNFLISLEKTNSDFIKKKEYWKIFLPILLLIALSVGAYFYINTSSPNESNQEKIFADNFSTYPNVVMPSVRSEGELNDLEKAFLFYDQEKFAEAEKLFESNDSDSLQSEILFYTAVSELAQNKMEESYSHFNQFQKEDNFYPHALWYKALIKLNKEESGAKELLEELLTFENPPFKKKTEKILEGL